MTPRNYAEIALVFVTLLILIVLVLTSLGGCVVGTRDDRLDEGRFTVDADCEKQRVQVELDLNRAEAGKKMRVTK